MLTYVKSFLAGLLLTAGLTGLASADQYVGNNPNTGLSGTQYLRFSFGTPPVMTGCNTGAPTYVGGPATGKITTVGTTTGCVAVLTYTIPILAVGAVAPSLNGVVCQLTDLTTPADLFTQSATAYTAPTATAAGSLTCTFTSRTIVSGDVLLYANEAF